MSRANSFLVLVVVALLTILLPVKRSDGSYRWSPTKKLSDLYAGARPLHVRWSPDADSAFATLITCDQPPGRCRGPDGSNPGDVLVVVTDSSMDWQASWSSRHYVTDSTSATPNAMGGRLFVDRDGDVHVLTETVGFGTYPGNVQIGYHARSGTSWAGNTAVLVSDPAHAGRVDIAYPESCDAFRHQNPTPRGFLFQDQSDDILHATWHYSATTDTGGGVFGANGVFTCDTLGSFYNTHTSKSVNDAEDAWTKVTYITDIYTNIERDGEWSWDGGGARTMFVDSFGVVHLWGRAWHRGLGASSVPDTLFWRHAWGIPPDPPKVRWEPEVDVFIDTLSIDTVGTAAAALVDENDVNDNEIGRGVAERNGFLYLTWNRVGAEAIIERLDGSPDSTIDTRYAPTGSPRALTPVGKNTEADHSLIRDRSDTAWHYFYGQAPTVGGKSQIWHKYTSNPDPYDASDPSDDNWTTPSVLTLDVGRDIQAGRSAAALARGDTTWVLFGADDAVDTGADQVFYRQGMPLGADSVGAGQKAVWDGLIALDRDFYVAPGGTLQVEPGTMVVAADSVDNSTGGWGENSSLIEIIVGGTLLANGTTNDHITFRGTDTSSTGGWYGIRFEDDAADTSLSSISYADFIAPVFAIGVDSLSGNILDCSFTGSQSGDIYVDRDTRIPAGYQWNLKAPTDVVISDTDAGADWGEAEEDPDRVEIFFEYSRLETSRPGTASPTDSVWFRSNSGVSDDWYGIGSWYSTMLVEDASLGHATHPLCFGVADSAWLRNSRIHTFHVEGVLDFWSDAAIEDNVIDGTGANNNDRIGVHTEFSAGNIEGNTVTWDGAQGQGAIGVLVEFSKAHCDASVGQDTVRVVSNTFVGDGEDNQANSTGLKLLWGCEHRHPRVEENLVQEWSLRGMEIRQCAETRLTCNEVADNWRGVYYTRTNAAAGDTVRFYQNDLLRSNHRNFETDWAYGVMLHDEYADPTNERGKNYFQVDADTTLGSVNIYHSGPQTIDATKNKWITAAGATTTDSTTIASMIEIDGSGAVDHSTPLTNVLGTQSCAPAGAPLIAQRGEAVADSPAGDDAATPARLIPEALPMSFALRSSFPNPGRSQVEIGYDVPVGYVEEVVLAVFDVTGRRVKRLVSGQVPPGRHRAVWSGRDEAGVRVAAGVYFVRLEARDFRRTTKIVLIR